MELITWDKNRQAPSYEKRKERALHWPQIWWHYFSRLWLIKNECIPPLTFLEIVKYAQHNTHFYIWNYMRYSEIAIPKERIKQEVSNATGSISSTGT